MKQMKRMLSIMLTAVMLITLIPANMAHANPSCRLSVTNWLVNDSNLMKLGEDDEGNVATLGTDDIPADVREVVDIYAEYLNDENEATPATPSDLKLLVEDGSGDWIDASADSSIAWCSESYSYDKSVPDDDGNPTRIDVEWTSDKFIRLSFERSGKYKLCYKDDDDGIIIWVADPLLGAYSGDNVNSSYVKEIECDLSEDSVQFYLIATNDERTYEYGIIEEWENLLAPLANSSGSPVVEWAQDKEVVVESKGSGVYLVTISGLEYGFDETFWFATKTKEYTTNENEAIHIDNGEIVDEGGEALSESGKYISEIKYDKCGVRVYKGEPETGLFATSEIGGETDDMKIRDGSAPSARSISCNVKDGMQLYAVYKADAGSSFDDCQPAGPDKLKLYKLDENDQPEDATDWTRIEWCNDGEWDEHGQWQETWKSDKFLYLSFDERGTYELAYMIDDETEAERRITIHVTDPMLGAYEGDDISSPYIKEVKYDDGEDCAQFYLIETDENLVYEYGIIKDWGDDVNGFTPNTPDTTPKPEQDYDGITVDVEPVVGKTGVYLVTLTGLEYGDNVNVCFGTRMLELTEDAKEACKDDDEQLLMKGEKYIRKIDYANCNVNVFRDEEPEPETGLFYTCNLTDTNDGTYMAFENDAALCFERIKFPNVRDGVELYVTYAKTAEDKSLLNPAALEALAIYRIVDDKGTLDTNPAEGCSINWCKRDGYTDAEGEWHEQKWTSDKFIELSFDRAGTYALCYVGSDKIADDNRYIVIDVSTMSWGVYLDDDAYSEYAREINCTDQDGTAEFYLIAGDAEEVGVKYTFGIVKPNIWNDENSNMRDDGLIKVSDIPIPNGDFDKDIMVEPVNGKTGVWKVKVEGVDYGEYLDFWFETRITRPCYDEEGEPILNEGEPVIEYDYQSCGVNICRDELSNDDGLMATNVLGQLIGENNIFGYPVRGFVRDEEGYPIDKNGNRIEKNRYDNYKDEDSFNEYQWVPLSAATIHGEMPVVEMYVEYVGNVAKYDELEIYYEDEDTPLEGIIDPSSYGVFQDEDGDGEPDLDESGDEIWIQGFTNDELISISVHKPGTYKLYYKGGKAKGERPILIDVKNPPLGIYTEPDIHSTYADVVDYDVEKGEAVFYLIPGYSNKTYEFGSMQSLAPADAENIEDVGSWQWDTWVPAKDNIPEVQNAKGRTATVEKVAGKDNVYKVTITNMKYGKSCMFAFLALMDKEYYETMGEEPWVAEAYVVVSWGELDVNPVSGSLANETKIEMAPAESDSDMADVIPNLDSDMTDILYDDKESKLEVDLTIDTVDADAIAAKDADTMTADEKKLADEIQAIEEEVKESDTKASGDLNFLDLSMNMTAVPSDAKGGRDKSKTQRVTETLEDIRVSLTLPESLKKVKHPNTKLDKKDDNLIYWIYRYHVDELGKAMLERLPATVKDGVLSFDTDRFSTYAVEVAENVATQLKISKAPATVAYTEGDVFDATGLELTISYADGTDEVVTSGFEVDKKTALTTEDETVTVSYGGLTVTQDITVSGVCDKGHDYGEVTYQWSEDMSECVAERVCKRDKAHTDSIKAVITSEITAQPTCETAGTKIYKAAFGKDWAEAQTKTETITATGHDYGEVTYKWSEDKSECVATRVCKKDAAHTESAKAVVSSETTVQPTIDTEGTKTYTAVFEAKWAEAQTATETLPKTTVTGCENGHDYGDVTYQWSEDMSACVATRVCKKDATHTDSIKAVVTSEITTQPTIEKEGVRTFTATFSETWAVTQVKTEAIPKKEAPKPGEKFGDDKKTGTYEVPSANKKEVTYCAPAGKSETKVTIPDTIVVDGVTYKVTKIADKAFYNNKKVTKVTIGKNIKTVGKNAFSGASKLKTVTVGANVTEIGENAFKGCSALTSLTLPAKTKTIKANAFNGCKKLKTLKIQSTKLTTKTVAKNAFKGLNKTTTIKVPKKKLTAYKKLFKSKGLSSKVKVKKY